MSFNVDEIKKIAHLARLNLSAEDISLFQPQLSGILEFITQMDKIDTTNIAPLAHSLDLSQRLRPDIVTEKNERDKFQKIAPQVEAGLYLVPQVIDEN